MAFRVRMISEVKYGEFGAYLETVRRLSKIIEARGWAPCRIMVPTAGRNNEIVVETEYPDLAAFEAENAAFYGDSEAFEAFRAGAEFIVRGSSRTEIYEDMPATFPS